MFYNKYKITVCPLAQGLSMAGVYNLDDPKLSFETTIGGWTNIYVYYDKKELLTIMFSGKYETKEIVNLMIALQNFLNDPSFFPFKTSYQLFYKFLIEKNIIRKGSSIADLNQETIDDLKKFIRFSSNRIYELKVQDGNRYIG